MHFEELEENTPLLLSAKNICKSFSGAQVLRGVGFQLKPGEVHVLAGENGAGKSTLIKIFAGIHPADDGDLWLAANTGVSVIHQETSLIDSMSVVDNLFLGRERVHWGILRNTRSQESEARKTLEKVGLDDINLSQEVGKLSLAVKSQIEIAKALLFETRIFIMDEPTSALNAPEVDRLFHLIDALKRKGCGVIYISHRMEEIYRIGDRISVLRDGRNAGTSNAKDLTQSNLVRWMIGKDLTPTCAAQSTRPALQGQMLRVQNFSVSRPSAVKDISFDAHRGEILGITGLQGSGATELMEGLFGVHGKTPRGQVFLEGKPFSICSPRESIQQGMAYLSPDRRRSGLILGFDIPTNLTLPSLDAVSRLGWIQRKKEKEIASRAVGIFQIRTNSLACKVGKLSGGNQQKVALAKWMEISPRVLLLNEPTRGVDVGAKAEIYSLIREWARKGCAILIITSEMPELLSLSDRILVLHRGRLMREFRREEASPEGILRAAMGEIAA